jgi:hypothetical protein
MEPDTLVQRILNNDLATLKDNLEDVVARKIVNRINQKKAEIIKVASGQKPEEKPAEEKKDEKPAEEKKDEKPVDEKKDEKPVDEKKEEPKT